MNGLKNCEYYVITTVNLVLGILTIESWYLRNVICSSVFDCASEIADKANLTLWGWFDHVQQFSGFVCLLFFQNPQI